MTETNEVGFIGGIDNPVVNQLTSALKKFNVGVYETVKAFKYGKLIGEEERVYGLKEDGVVIPESTKNLVSQDIIDYVNTISEKVKNRKIRILGTKEEYKAMNK